MTTSAFEVDFHTREGSEQRGPLALLWDLIESYEVDIFEVSLKLITDDFLDHMRKSELTVEEEAEFAVMAARLIFYKSKLLLPDPGFEDEYEDDSLPIELVEQLLEFKRYQQAAEQLRELEEASIESYSGQKNWDPFDNGENYVEVELISFLSVFRDFLEKQDKLRPVEIEEEAFTIEELIENIRDELRKQASLSFFSYIKGFSLLRCIGVFLAVLELIKLREIGIEQEAPYKDILVTPRVTN